MSVYFEKARELGKLILDSEESKRYRHITEQLSKSEETNAKIDAFKAYQERIATEINNGSLSPSETEAKSSELMKRLDEINKEPLILAQRDADNDYNALIDKVFDILNLTLGRNPDVDNEGCCGSCSGCGKSKK